MTTLDEWFPNGRGDGRIFKEMGHPFIFEPIIKTNDAWHILRQDNGKMDSYSGTALKLHVLEHKPKITRWLWTDKTGVVLSSFAANHEEILKREYGSEFDLETIKNYWIKLEWSATEFEI